jgi:hypothetical protein
MTWVVVVWVCTLLGPALECDPATRQALPQKDRGACIAEARRIRETETGRTAACVMWHP